MARRCVERAYIVMAMSLIMSTCIFDVCLSNVLPQFISTPGDRPVIGQTLSLSCTFSGDAFTIILQKKVQAATTDIAYQDTVMSCSRGSTLRAGAWVPPCPDRGWNLTVVLPNVQPTDSAEYICDVTMHDINVKNAKAFKTVTIIVPPRTPSISGSLKVIENNRLSLSCDGATDTSVINSNAVTLPVLYRWKRQGLFLQDTPSLDLRSYIVDQVNPDQAGSYTCVAVNDAGQTESAAVNVDIYYLPKTVTLTTQNAPHLAGATEEFRCTASTANPTPNLRLMRLKGPDTTEIFSDVTLQFTSAIVLKSADNQAQFYCEASSEDAIPDRKTTSAKVTFDVMFPPEVTVSMTHATAQENEDTIMTCDARSGNPTEITRYQWDFRRPDASTYTLLSNTSSRDLAFRVQYNSDGFYKCTAANAAGQESDEKRLNVLFSPRTDDLYKPQTEVAGEVDKPATFALKLISNPQPSTIRWYKEGTVIALSDTNFQQNRPSPYELSLVIPRVKVELYGQYNCSVGNGIGREKTFTFTLLMAGAPVTPSALRVVDITARSITLSWTSEFTGGSPQKFSIMYKLADESWPEKDQIVNIDDPGYKSTVRYRISDLDPHKWYIFRVRASNQYPGNNKSDYTSFLPEQTLELPKTEDLRAYRDGNEITVSWRQPIGTYTGVTIEYCITATTVCSNYSVPDISENTATLTVDEGKTYIYYLHLLQTDDVLFTSAPFHAVQAPIRTSNIGFIAGGAGLGLLIIVIVVVVILCNRRRRGKAKKKREMELHNMQRSNKNRTLSCGDAISVNRALMGTENLGLNNTPQRSINDLRMTSDAHNHYRKHANIPGPDVVPNIDGQHPIENDYANTNITGVPIGQVDPMQRVDKAYENLMVPNKNKALNPNIPELPIQTVSADGIVYTQVFYTLANNRPVQQHQPHNNNNNSDHYARIDVTRSSSNARPQQDEIPTISARNEVQVPPPYHPRTHESEPRSPDNCNQPRAQNSQNQPRPSSVSSGSPGYAQDNQPRSRGDLVDSTSSQPRSPVVFVDGGEHYLEHVV